MFFFNIFLTSCVSFNKRRGRYRLYSSNELCTFTVLTKQEKILLSCEKIKRPPRKTFPLYPVSFRDTTPIPRRDTYPEGVRIRTPKSYVPRRGKGYYPLPGTPYVVPRRGKGYEKSLPVPLTPSGYVSLRGIGV